MIPVISRRKIRHNNDQWRDPFILYHVVDHIFEAISILIHPSSFIAISTMLKIKYVIFCICIVLIVSIGQINGCPTLNCFSTSDIIFCVISKSFQCTLLCCCAIISIRHRAKYNILHIAFLFTYCLCII